MSCKHHHGDGAGGAFSFPDIFVILKDETQMHDSNHSGWDVRVNPANSIDKIIAKLNEKIPELKGFNRIFMKNSFGEETPVLESFVLQDGKEYIARHETIEQTHETEAFAMLDEQDMESAAICIQRRWRGHSSRMRHGSMIKKRADPEKREEKEATHKTQRENMARLANGEACDVGRLRGGGTNSRRRRPITASSPSCTDSKRVVSKPAWDNRTLVSSSKFGHGRLPKWPPSPQPRSSKHRSAITSVAEESLGYSARSYSIHTLVASNLYGHAGLDHEEGRLEAQCEAPIGSSRGYRTYRRTEFDSIRTRLLDGF